jgi:hypothetical protein
MLSRLKNLGLNEGCFNMNKIVKMMLCVAMLQTAALFSAAGSVKQVNKEMILAWVVNKSNWHSGEVQAWTYSGEPVFKIEAAGAEPKYIHITESINNWNRSEPEMVRSGLKENWRNGLGIEYQMVGSLRTYVGKTLYDDLKKNAGKPIVRNIKDATGKTYPTDVSGVLITFEMGYLRDLQVSLSSMDVSSLDAEFWAGLSLGRDPR